MYRTRHRDCLQQLSDLVRAQGQIAIAVSVLALLSAALWWSRRPPARDEPSTPKPAAAAARSGGDGVPSTGRPTPAPGSRDVGFRDDDSGLGRSPSAEPDAGRAESGLMRVLALNRSVAQCEERRLCGDGVCRVWTGSERVACFRSNCTPDAGAGCGPGDWCQQFGAVWRCAPDGTAELGASCLPDRFANRGQRCSQGRECIAGICSHPCPSSHDCTGGSSCVLVGGSHYCLPQAVICARDGDCRDDRACVNGVCAQRMEIRPGVLSCVPGQCPSSQVCDGELIGSSVWAECRESCQAKPCPAGARCVAPGGLAGTAQVCEPACPCGPGEACHFRANAPQDGTCRPTSPTDPERSSLFEWQEAFAGMPDGFPDAGT